MTRGRRTASATAPRRARGAGAEIAEVEGRRLRLTNLDRVLWPEAGFTKRAMLDYYTRIAPSLLPYLRGRPCTMMRAPEGADQYGWFQTQCRGRPVWLATQAVDAGRGEIQNYCVFEDLPALLWAANLGTLEFHPLLARGEAPDRPTAVVFDLDPGPPATLIDCCAVALEIRRVLDDLGLAAFAKTSGSVGLHLYVPLNTPHTFVQTKAFARAVARDLARLNPDAIVDVQARPRRVGKVLIDWLQNDRNRSTVAPYSLRAMAWPTVSTPVAWNEIRDALRHRDADGLTFGPSDAPERLSRLGDLFEPVLRIRQWLDGG